MKESHRAGQRDSAERRVVTETKGREATALGSEFHFGVGGGREEEEEG